MPSPPSPFPPIADGEFGGNLRDGKTGSVGRERGAAAAQGFAGGEQFRSGWSRLNRVDGNAAQPLFTGLPNAAPRIITRRRKFNAPQSRAF